MDQYQLTSTIKPPSIAGISGAVKAYQEEILYDKLFNTTFSKTLLKLAVNYEAGGNQSMTIVFKDADGFDHVSVYTYDCSPVPSFTAADVNLTFSAGFDSDIRRTVISTIQIQNIKKIASLTVVQNTVGFECDPLIQDHNLLEYFYLKCYLSTSYKMDNQVPFKLQLSINTLSYDYETPFFLGNTGWPSQPVFSDYEFYPSKTLPIVSKLNQLIKTHYELVRIVYPSSFHAIWNGQQTTSGEYLSPDDIFLPIYGKLQNATYLALYNFNKPTLTTGMFYFYSRIEEEVGSRLDYNSLYEPEIYDGVQFESPSAGTTSTILSMQTFVKSIYYQPLYRTLFSTTLQPLSFPYGITSGDLQYYMVSNSFFKPKYIANNYDVYILTSSGISNTFTYNGSPDERDTEAPKIQGINIKKWVDGQFLIQITVTDNLSGVLSIGCTKNQFKLGVRDLIKGNTKDGVFEKLIPYSSINLDTPIQYIITDFAYNQRVYIDRVLPDSGLEIPHPFQFPQGISKNTLITHFRFDKKSVNVMDSAINNTLYINWVGANQYSPIPTFTNLQPNAVYNNYKNLTYYGKWNQLLGMFQIDFIIPRRSFEGEFKYKVTVNQFEYLYFELDTIYLNDPNRNNSLKIICEDADLMPPIVKNIIAKPSVTLSDTPINITWTIEIEDLKNGLDYAEILIASTLDYQGKWIRVVPFEEGSTGNEFLGTYNISIEIPLNCTSQTYFISKIITKDTQLNFGESDLLRSINPLLSTYQPSFSSSFLIPNTTITCPINLVGPNSKAILKGFNILDKSPVSVYGSLQNRTRSVDFKVDFQDEDNFPAPSLSKPTVYIESHFSDRESFPSYILEIDGTVIVYRSYIIVPYGFSGEYDQIIFSVYGIVNAGNKYIGSNSLELISSGFLDSSLQISKTISGTPNIDSVKYNQLENSFLFFGESFGYNSQVQFQIKLETDMAFKSLSVVESETLFSGTKIRIIISDPNVLQRNFTIKVIVDNISSNELQVYLPEIPVPSPTPTATPTNTPTVLPTLSPTHSPSPSPTPQQPCPGVPECGGEGHGTCEQSKCICQGEWFGFDCQSRVVKLDPPKVDNNNPNVELELPGGPKTSFSSLISIQSLRELDQENKEVSRIDLTDWVLHNISSNGTTQLLYTTSFIHRNINTTVNITITWFTETKTISFANRNIVVQGSTSKYNVGISSFGFERSINKLQLIMTAKFNSSDKSGSCSLKEFVDNDPDFQYVKLQVNDHSLYANLIKYGIVDSETSRIENILLDDSNRTTTSFESQARLGIIIPPFKTIVLLDPDFSMLVDTRNANNKDGSNCGNQDDGMSKQTLAGIIIGSVLGVATWDSMLKNPQHQVNDGDDPLQQHSNDKIIHNEPPFKIDKTINSKIIFYMGELWRLDTDAIVYPNTTNLSDRSGIAGPIFKYGGGEMVVDIEKNNNECKCGEAIITGSGNLPSKYVIHTCCPTFNPKYLSAAENALNGCYRSAFQLLNENNGKSIAFACLHTEKRYYPPNNGAHIALRTIRRFLEKPYSNSLDRVVLCMDNITHLDLYRRLLPLYFPRTKEELLIQQKHLPEEYGDDQGETVDSERRIRIVDSHFEQSKFILRNLNDDYDEEVNIFKDNNGINNQKNNNINNNNNGATITINSNGRKKKNSKNPFISKQEHPDIVKQKNQSMPPSQYEKSLFLYNHYVKQSKEVDLSGVAKLNFIFQSTDPSAAFTRTIAFIIRIEHEVSGKLYDYTDVYEILIIYGTLSMLLEWTSIGFFWISLYHTFFKHDINLKFLRKMDLIQNISLVVLIMWGTALVIAGTKVDVNLVYVIMFLVIIIVLVIFFGVYGAILHRALLKEKSKGGKVSSAIEIAAKKTITLLIILVILVVLTFVKLVVFLVLEQNKENDTISDLISFFLELAQIALVMIVLCSGSVKKFFVFQKATNSSFDKTSSQQSGEITLGKQQSNRDFSVGVTMTSFDAQSSVCETSMNENNTENSV
eukprot:gene533-672_t